MNKAGETPSTLILLKVSLLAKNCAYETKPSLHDSLAASVACNQSLCEVSATAMTTRSCGHAVQGAKMAMPAMEAPVIRKSSLAPTGKQKVRAGPGDEVQGDEICKTRKLTCVLREQKQDLSSDAHTNRVRVLYLAGVSADFRTYQREPTGGARARTFLWMRFKSGPSEPQVPTLQAPAPGHDTV